MIIKKEKYRKLNEILNEIRKYGISDDSIRGIKVEKISYEKLLYFNEINSEYGELLIDYADYKYEINEQDELYSQCESFLSFCTLARIELENSKDTRHFRHKEYLNFIRENL